MQTALDSNFRGWAIPTVHLGSRPRLLHHLSASPVVSRTTTNNDILHSCQDKGESRDGRGQLGCRGTPPKPCTSLGGARSGRRGPPGGAGMVGQRGGLGAGVGVPGTHQHLFPGDLGYVCGLHKRPSQGAAANVCRGFPGAPRGTRGALCIGTRGALVPIGDKAVGPQGSLALSVPIGLRRSEEVTSCLGLWGCC